MTDNLVSTISRFLTPDLIGKMASMAGLDRPTGQKAAAAAVPAILSGLASVAGTPAGARQLASAVAEQPSDLLSGIANMLGGSAQPGDRGNSLLSSLLGGGMSGILTSTLGKFLGIGEGPMRTLMGLLTPVILGVLGREQRAAGLDTGGLARMLTSQTDEIAAAMPAGLGRMLESSGFHEGLAMSAPRERPAYEMPRGTDERRTYDAPHASIGRAANEATASRRSTWAYWVLPLLALGGLLWYLSPRDESAPETATIIRTAPPGGPATALVYLTNARSNWSSIGTSPNEYTRREIYNASGETLGTISDLLVEPDGKPAAAVINVGRFLGIGDKEIAVPFSMLRVERQGDNRRIIIDVLKDSVQAAPAFARPAAAKQ